MADATQMKILGLGSYAWNEWREQGPEIAPDLRGSDFSRSDLAEVELDDADMSGIKLRGANLCGASLVGADLSEADLSGADLREADLAFSSFMESIVDGTNFADAILFRTVFGDVDLSGAKGLECVEHHGPSTIGIDTIYRSGGNIPESFLRGCGVPEEFIIYAKSLVGKPLEYYSCFISYSTSDQEFADRLHADLQARQVRCWFARHDIQGGKKLHEQIDEAIRVYDKLLLIISENSMNSEWVKTEISKARKREATERRRMLFPIRLVDFERISRWECFDADSGKDSAREIREFYIPDFSVWKTNHDLYKKEFDRLIRDLKA